MNELLEMHISRKRIAIRFLFTLFFLAVLEILKLIVQLTVVFQYLYLFIFQKYNEPVQGFANKAVIYTYRVMRYMTLNENTCPFPFTDFPVEMEAPERDVQF